MNLKEREERLEFLASKINSEISKFKDIKKELEEKKSQLIEDVEGVGAQNVNISLFSKSDDNILEYINAHSLELENMKNYLENELKKIRTQIKLLDKLNKKYGDKIVVEQDKFGGFKIRYNDEDVDNAIQKAELSKKLLSTLKNINNSENKE